MAEIYLGEDAPDKKLMHCQNDIPDRATADKMLAEDSRFMGDWEKYIISSHKGVFRIVHMDSCAKHPSYDADECPFRHPENV